MSFSSCVELSLAAMASYGAAAYLGADVFYCGRLLRAAPTTTRPIWFANVRQDARSWPRPRLADRARTGNRSASQPLACSFLGNSFPLQDHSLSLIIRILST